MAILCCSYKIEAAALSKLNPARKILAHVSQAILHDARVQTDERAIRQHGSPVASQMIDINEAPVCAGKNERNQVMPCLPLKCLPLRSPPATELLIR